MTLNNPIYDINNTYEYNALNGPFFNDELPLRKDVFENKSYDFLGHKVASRIGVAAGPLLNSKWIKLALDLGFDIVTYKTIRSNKHSSHPLPNVSYVKIQNNSLYLADENPQSIDDLSITNSFGMPSMSPSFLLHDIDLAKSYLKKNQAMIVSVVGSNHAEISFLDDFVKAACLAKDAGATLIEANFSCPNVDKTYGCLYHSSNAVFEISKAIADAIHPIPLIIKIGLFDDLAQMKDVFLKASKANVRAVAAINSINMPVINKYGQTGLDNNRTTSGICGTFIRNKALQFINDAAKIIKNEQLDLCLIGMGGIVKPEHFDDFINLGADFSFSASGMMWDPYLAHKYHVKNEEKK